MNPRRPIEEETSNSSLSDAAERYLGWQVVGRTRALSEKSLRPMRGSLGRWAASVGPETMTKDLTLPDLEDYLNFLRKPHDFGDDKLRPGLADQSIKSQIAIIRAFFNWLLDRKYLVHESMFKAGGKFAVKTPEVMGGTKDVYRPEQLDLMWAAVEEVDKSNRTRNRAILSVLLGSGIRLGELANLDDSDLQGDQLFIRAPKNRKPHWVPINGIVQDAIREYKSKRRAPERSATDREPLFLGEGGGRLSEIGLQRVIQRLKKWADGGLGHPMKAGPHKFRHTYATYTVIRERQLKGECNWDELADRLGHSSTSVTKKNYFHYDPNLKVPDRWARYLWSRPNSSS